MKKFLVYGLMINFEILWGPGKDESAIYNHKLKVYDASTFENVWLK